MWVIHDESKSKFAEGDDSLEMNMSAKMSSLIFAVESFWAEEAR